MSAIFDGYEKDFLELNSTITRFNALIPTLQRDEKKAKMAEAEAATADAEALIRRMDLEARSLPAGVKAPLVKKLSDYKASMTKLKADLKKASNALVDTGAARDELLSRAELGDSSGGAATSGAQRDKLLSANERAKKTSDRIGEATKTLLDTEEIGVGILQNLHSQRNTILHARENLAGADDNISKARKVLTSMSKRAMQNKIMLGGIIVLLIGAIIIIIYVKVH